MKKGWFVFLLLALFSVPGWAKLRVFACEPEWGALAEALGAGQVKVFVATTARQDPHHIQARPSLIAKMRRTDLLVCTGAGLEVGWLPLLLRKAHNGRLQPGQPGYLLAANHVPLLEKPQRLDRSEGDIHALGNPHIQTDPRNMLRVAGPLSARLTQLDPDHRDDYQQRLEQFRNQWLAAIRQWESKAQPLRGMRIVVHHRQWPYLEKWLGLKQVAELEPKPGIPPSPGHLASLKSRLSHEPAQAIIHAAYMDAKPAQWLEKQTGIPAVMLPFTVGGSPEADDLYGLYEDTINRLLKAQP